MQTHIIEVCNLCKTILLSFLNVVVHWNTICFFAKRLKNLWREFLVPIVFLFITCLGYG